MKITYRHLLYSITKWAAVSLACVEEDKKALKDALDNMYCGYCKADVIRKHRHKNFYEECIKCNLQKKGVCGVDGAPYYKIEDADTTWETKRRAARKVFRAILEDVPRDMVPERWLYDD